MMNSAVAEVRKVDLRGEKLTFFQTQGLPQPDAAVNRYVNPEATHVVLTSELSKIQQIIEYLKVLYR